MDWCRLYAEMPHDPKVGTLSDAEFRSFTELLCLAAGEGRKGETGVTKDTVNWKLRRDVTVTLHALSQRNLIYENSDGIICITNWHKRQPTSDSSAERTKKYREKLKEKQNDNNEEKTCDVTETSQKRHSDALDKIREEKKEKESAYALSKKSGDFEKFWQVFPKLRAGNKQKAEKAYIRALSRASPEEIQRGVEAYTGSSEVAGGRAKGAEAWLNDDRWTVRYAEIDALKSKPQNPRKYGNEPVKTNVPNLLAL